MYLFIVIIMQLPPFNKNIRIQPQHSQIFANSKHRFRSEEFNNRFATEKSQQYDALQDPHASYYFSSKSVKQHLKTLHRAIEQQRNKSERFRLKKLISMQINKSFYYIHQRAPIHSKDPITSQAIGLRKIAVHSSNSNHIKCKSGLKDINILKKTSQNRDSLSNIQDKVADARINLYENRKECQKDDVSNEKRIETLNSMKAARKVSKQGRYANKLAESLHEMKHQKWVTFLKQRKQKAVANLQLSSKLAKSSIE